MIYPSPFDDDDELAEAYQALAEEAQVPAENRRNLIRRLAPVVAGLSAALLVVGAIGSYALSARDHAAQTNPTPTDPSAKRVVSQVGPPTVPQSPGSDGQSQGHPVDGQRLNPLPTTSTFSDSTKNQVHDLAIRYAYTWANRGGGLDPIQRQSDLAFMRGQDPSTVTQPEDDAGLQVVLNAHVANMETSGGLNLVTVSLLLAGDPAPQWAALQIPISASTTGGWTVVGDPAWVPYTPIGKADGSHTIRLTWVSPEQSTSREQLTAFFTQYGEQAQVHDPAIVSKPIAGLRSLVRFDRLEGVATGGEPQVVYARVRWVNTTGLGMSQVYRLATTANGGIDSVQVAAID